MSLLEIIFLQIVIEGGGWNGEIGPHDRSHR
jgi:hypothetical protein